MLPPIRACPLVLLAACHTVPSQASEPSPTTEGPIVKFYDVHDLVILEGSRANKLLVPEASVIERPIRRPLRVPGDALAAAAQTVLQDSFAWDETCSIACTDGLLTLLGPATAHGSSR